MTNEERFGQWLIELRRGQGWSRREAATKIGISHMRLAELEAGQSRTTQRATRPTREVAAKIAAAYGLPVDALLEAAGYARERPELSDEDSLLLDLFRGLDPERRAMVVRIVQAIRG